jgi:hypothetical protein
LTRSRKGILGEAAGLSIGTVLAALAAVRRGKAFHPEGVVYDARLSIASDPAAPQAAELLSRGGEHRAIARSPAAELSASGLITRSAQLVSSLIRGMGRRRPVTSRSSVSHPAQQPAAEASPFSSSRKAAAGWPASARCSLSSEALARRCEGHGAR